MDSIQAVDDFAIAGPDLRVVPRKFVADASQLQKNDAPQDASLLCIMCGKGVTNLVRRRAGACG